MQLKPLLIVAMLALAGPAHALYKIVGPDGSVTYTDLPPPPGSGQVSTLSPPAAGNRSPVQLPLELREATAHHPVTLFTTQSCPACDQARELLRQRGVPHVEKTTQSEADREAWPRIVGGIEAPVLRIGSQTVRTLDRDEWNSHLDAAGYPQQSMLPPNYEFPAPEPLVPREEARPTPAPPRTAPPASETAPTAPGVKF